jgi:hypothetical protein
VGELVEGSDGDGKTYCYMATARRLCPPALAWAITATYRPSFRHPLYRRIQRVTPSWDSVPKPSFGERAHYPPIGMLVRSMVIIYRRPIFFLSKTNRRTSRQQPHNPKLISLHASRITLYDTNLFVADATPTEAFPSPQNRVFIKSCLA